MGKRMAKDRRQCKREERTATAAINQQQHDTINSYQQTAGSTRDTTREDKKATLGILIQPLLTIESLLKSLKHTPNFPLSAVPVSVCHICYHLVQSLQVTCGCRECRDRLLGLIVVSSAHTTASSRPPLLPSHSRALKREQFTPCPPHPLFFRMAPTQQCHDDAADDEEVDAFGRIVPKESRRRSRSRSRSRSNSPDREESDFRRRRYADNDDSRRRRSRSPDRQRERDGGRERERDGRGGDKRSGRRREERRRDDRRPPPSAPMLSITPRSFHRQPPSHQQPFPPHSVFGSPSYGQHQYPSPIHLTFPSHPPLLSTLSTAAVTARVDGRT